MRKILCICLVTAVSFFASGCHMERTNSRFHVVIVESGQDLLADQDIASYECSPPKIRLNEQGIAKWNSHIVYNETFTPPIPILGGLYKKEFAVKIGDDEMYRGKFWSMASSLSYDGIVILDTSLPLGRKYGATIADSITIECGYSGLVKTCGSMHNPKIREFFEKQGKLMKKGIRS